MNIAYNMTFKTGYRPSDLLQIFKTGLFETFL